MTYLFRIRKLEGLLMLILIATFVLAASPVLAEDGEKSWQPQPPMPDDFDWIQMTSGEWLKGEIIAMYEEELEFDSKEFDEQTLDWEDIQQIRSAQTMQVAFLDDTIVTGKLLVDGDRVRLMGEQDWEYERSQVLSITAGEPKERNYWSAKVSAGLNYRTGNTEQTEFNTKAMVLRRTPKDRINFDYLGTFSENEGTTIADNQRASAGWNRFISKRFFITPVYGEYYRDPFQNIASRWTLGAGLGYQIIDSSKIDWNVDGGIAYQLTNFDDVLEGESDTESSPALVIGMYYDNELTGWLDFSVDYRFFIVNEESGTYTHHLVTGFEFDLVGDLEFDITWVWDRIQDPRQNSDSSFPEQDDLRTMFGLGFSF